MCSCNLPFEKFYISKPVPVVFAVFTSEMKQKPMVHNRYGTLQEPSPYSSKLCNGSL